MVMSDPIADMLTRIRNANVVRHETVEMPASKVKKQIAEILKREGFIRDAEYIEDNKQGIIRIFLKYGLIRARYHWFEAYLQTRPARLHAIN